MGGADRPYRASRMICWPAALSVPLDWAQLPYQITTTLETEVITGPL